MLFRSSLVGRHGFWVSLYRGSVGLTRTSQGFWKRVYSPGNLGIVQLETGGLLLRLRLGLLARLGLLRLRFGLAGLKCFVQALGLYGGAGLVKL